MSARSAAAFLFSAASTVAKLSSFSEGPPASETLHALDPSAMSWEREEREDREDREVCLLRRADFWWVSRRDTCSGGVW